MNDSVLIKGNSHGLSIFLDDQVDFFEIKMALRKKMTDGRKFFGQSKVSIHFDGRKLSNTEQEELLEIINLTSDLEVFCVIDDNIPSVKAPEVMTKVQNNGQQHVVGAHLAKFHQGTLRSGQEVIVESSLVVFGDVNPGAKIVADGHVIVLGNLKGQVHAGAKGEEKAVVFALNMQPTQVRIGQVIARSPDRFDGQKTESQLAFIEDQQIYIEHIHGGLLNDIKILS